MSLGPVMLDVVGTELTADDVRRLQHPLVGGVILFARNFSNCAQLTALTASIHAVRSPPILIAVDHEGGRVQRFRDGFTKIPPMREFGKIWDVDRKKAKELAVQAGWILAAELRAHGVDFSFTPVLDMDYGDSLVPPAPDRPRHVLRTCRSPSDWRPAFEPRSAPRARRTEGARATPAVACHSRREHQQDPWGKG